VDISDVMKQYETTHADFHFIGPLPIDFQLYKNGNCVGRYFDPSACPFQIDQFKKKNKERIGIVLNLDKHDEPGSHWVSLFIDFTREKICYYDSVGTAPPSEIWAFVDFLKKQNPRMSFEFNKKRHQFKNTECGIYSLYCMDYLLEHGVDAFSTFVNTVVLDNHMHQNRKFFFNPLHLD